VGSMTHPARPLTRFWPIANRKIRKRLSIFSNLL
jgi:hypothetical protein